MTVGTAQCGGRLAFHHVPLTPMGMKKLQRPLWPFDAGHREAGHFLRSVGRRRSSLARNMLESSNDPRFFSAVLLTFVSDLDTSYGGLVFIMVSCMALATMSAWLDGTGIVVAISDMLIPDGVLEEGDGDKSAATAEQARTSSTVTKARVRNPLTQRMIDVEGPTYRRLQRRGLLDDSIATDSEGGWDFQELDAGTGIVPHEGSVALIRFEARLGGPRGPVVASSAPDDPPFTFEVLEFVDFTVPSDTFANSFALPTRWVSM